MTMKKKNKGEENDILYNGDVEYVHIGQALLAHLIDVFMLIGIWALMYFSICYPVTVNNASVKKANQYLSDVESSLRLDINKDAEWKEKEEIIQNFYFVEYSDEIKEWYLTNTVYDGISVTAYYNIRVLGLTFEPGSAYEGTGLYQYVRNEDGSWNVDVLGEMIVPEDELSGRGKRNLNQLYTDGIEGCLYMLQDIDPDYLAATRLVKSSALYGSAASFSFVYLLLFALLPLLLPNKASVGQAVLGFGVCTKRGYLAHWYQIEGRALLGMIPLFFGAYLFDPYSVVILIVLPIFLNFLYPLFTGKRQTLLDTVFGLRVIINQESTVYKNELDKKIADKNVIPSYKDPDYVTTLAATETMGTPDDDLNN